MIHILVRVVEKKRLDNIIKEKKLNLTTKTRPPVNIDPSIYHPTNEP